MIELLLLLTALAALGYSALRLWSAGLEKPGHEPHRKTAPGAVDRLLLQLNIPIGAPAFIAGLSASGLGLSWLLSEATSLSFAAALATATGLLVLGLLLLLDLAGRRARRFEVQLLDAMDLMSAALQGGLPPRQALLAAAQGSRGALQDELREIVQRLDLGLNMDQALHRIVTRYDIEGVRLFQQALIAKWQAGGDFAALLKAVNSLIRERIKLRTQVEGQLSGARYAAIFSGGLPYLLIPLFLWKQPEWFEPLFAHPRGLTLLVGAALLQLSGFLWLRRILRVQL